MINVMIHDDDEERLGMKKERGFGLQWGGAFALYDAGRLLVMAL